jgi:hypothetical protein
MASGAADWLKKDKRRLLHVVYRVGDMQVKGGGDMQGKEGGHRGYAGEGGGICR